MIIGIPRESLPGETRVAATPQTVGQLIKLGYEVVVESGAGAASSFSDEAFTRGRCRHRVRRAGLGGRRGAQGERAERRRDRRPARRRDPDQPDLPRAETRSSSSSWPPARSPCWPWMRCRASPGPSRWTCCRRWPTSRATAPSSRPRTSFGRFFTGQVTAAGKVPPAKVLVVGAGVAGLAAIGAAGSLGAIVRATDPRPEVADQVKSLGGEYLSIESPEAEVSATGYAKEMGDDYKAREAQLYAEQCQGRRHHHHHRADPRQARRRASSPPTWWPR